MNPFFNMMRPNPMANFMNLLQQVRTIKQNPSQLATLLKQRGMITDEQVTQVEQLGNNYEELGRFLMGNGKVPTNVQQYQGQVEQVQNMMNNQQ